MVLVVVVPSRRSAEVSSLNRVFLFIVTLCSGVILTGFAYTDSGCHESTIEDNLDGTVG